MPREDALSPATRFAPFAGRDGPAIVAHRGASAVARENTVEAFARARELGADAVELDVRRTADGCLVVNHDASVPGVGPLVERTLDELRAAAPWIPTLEDALAACEGMWVNVEVKNSPLDPDWDPNERVAATVADWVAAQDAFARVLVSSFNPAALGRAREVARQIATALLTAHGVDPLGAVDAAADAGHVAYHPPHQVLAGGRAGEVVRRARARGLAVVPWTVDDPREIRSLAESGVDGVITNVPDVARAAAAPY